MPEKYNFKEFFKNVEGNDKPVPFWSRNENVKSAVSHRTAV